MRKKSMLAVMLSTMLTLPLLAACGNGANTAQPQTEAPKAQEPAATEQVVNVFTARHYDIDSKLFAEFTKQTGIKVNEVKGTAEELVERLKREGESSEADLFITVDGGVLNYAKQNGVLQPIQSAKVEKNVPKELRDPDNQWIGMATRARVIVYAKDRVKPEQLSTYEDLATDKWKGKVLVRSSSNLYNQSLVASFIELNGEQAALDWAKGLVNNFARKPEGGDRDQAKAVVAKVGDVAIMNTYYVGQMLNSKDAEEVKVAQNIGVFFPNQETTGTHLNISGIGLTKHAKNKDNAVKLIEFVTGKEAQTMLTNGSYEFPVNAEADKPALLKEWGEFKTQKLDFAKLGEYNKKAVELLNQAGWK
ncbi:Fe(3+) ABC transporter substrate-binding protein [Brevibacillus porteri]|uniref:Fe(3+) ABC transporter substrate-binding protein n=1 Tax=Brevibacillus porteri TaxID=2126350 RepID=A0ABX5FMH9_9BACL|nr:Fe(3+) ABC transporter substrate-binding protein [Brevibacillus porteri]MED1803112.1 Fe(3+) ABC transporter substrate-binding protein [Brevibacillus porteri]MED2135289.1 Fe(3+) ABC transporter substrate-binding protein [Brevibacillus porteri]MED2748603.1 Fe(3+) ABC transporter substrate-binding protein [Brevibacillus porteri]MED2818271.1 Fe(3+) ABC transporter substrate-binding protein [Brevibacillus porteri]MED2898003.1 Fe(3+) ABC transporter substrate-binding protein [Brevibacillus porter